MRIIGQIYKVIPFDNRMCMYIFTQEGRIHKIPIEYYNRIVVELPNFSFTTRNGNLEITNNQLQVEQSINTFINKCSDKILSYEIVDAYKMNSYSNTPSRFIVCYIKCTPRALINFIGKSENNDIKGYIIHEDKIGIDVKFFGDYNLDYAGIYEFSNILDINKYDIYNAPDKLKIDKINFYDPRNIIKVEEKIKIVPRIGYFDIETYTPRYKVDDDNMTFAIPTNLDDTISIISYIVKHDNIIKKFCYCMAPYESNIHAYKSDDFQLFTFQSEKDMLIAFLNAIRNSELVMITGYNIFNYDLRYINFRCVLHGIDVSNDIIYKRSTGEYILNMNGILCVDYLKFVKSHISLTELSSRKLKDVCKHLGLTDGKIDMEYSEVNNAYTYIVSDPYNNEYNERYMKVIDYCIRDSEVLYGITDKLNTWLTFTAFANIHYAGIDVIANEGQVRKLTNLIYYWMHKFKYIFIPSNQDKIKYEGGYVHLSSPGFHKNIAIVDFASLYPSLIISNNLCPTTIIPFGYDGNVESKTHVIEYNKVVISDSFDNEIHDVNYDDDTDVEKDDEPVYIDESLKPIEKPIYEYEESDTPSIKKLRDQIKAMYDSGLTNEYHELFELEDKLNKMLEKRKNRPIKEKTTKDCITEFFNADQKETFKKETRVVKVVPETVRKGVFPQILTYLLSRRKEVKKEMNAAEKIYLEYKTSDSPDPTKISQLKFEFDEKEKLQLAFKITANSLYGICCAKGDISCIEVGVITTMLGRTAIQNVNRHLADQGYPHIYSDTDSSMVNIGDCTEKSTLENIRSLFPGMDETFLKKKLEFPYALNKFQSIVDYMNNHHIYYNDPMNLEFETYSMEGVWLKKKFYVCRYKNEKGEDKYKSRGTVDRRSDKPQILKDIFKKLYIQILDEHNPNNSLKLIYDFIAKLKDLPIEQFEISKGYRGVSKYANPETAPMVRFVFNAERFGVCIEADARARYIMSNECYAKPNEDDDKEYVMWCSKLNNPTEKDIIKFFTKIPGYHDLKKEFISYYPNYAYLYPIQANVPSVPCARSSPYSADYWAVQEMKPTVDYMKYMKFMESQLITMLTKAYPCIEKGIHYDVDNNCIITQNYCHNCLLKYCTYHNQYIEKCDSCCRDTKCMYCKVCINCYCSYLKCVNCIIPSNNTFEIMSMFTNINLLNLHM